jgi:hypothetical protein
MTPTDRLIVLVYLAFMVYVLVAPAIHRWRVQRANAQRWALAQQDAREFLAHERRLKEIDAAARDIEEVRLMPGQGDPGDENDSIPEGLGVVRPPARLAAQFPKLTLAQLTNVARRRAQEHTA